MKKILLVLLFTSIYFKGESQPVISEKGHPEHAIAGAVIGGGVSYLVYRKTGKKFTSWLIGSATASVIGLAKELIDPSLGNNKTEKDFFYTAAGGAIGASIVFPLRSRKKRKKTPNINATFEENSLETLSLIYPD